MKYLAALLLMLAAGNPSPEIRYFHCAWPIENIPATARQTCFVVNPNIFAQAAPQLADLRLYRNSTEVPYTIQAAGPAADSDQQVSPLNLGRRGGQTVFDAAMHAGGYRDVQLAVSGQNFIATVRVSGSQDQTGSAETRIGSFTIFDLTREKLGRSTVLHLPKSDFRFLHFRIDGPVLPDAVESLTVLRAAATAPKYIAVAASQRFTQQGRDTTAEFLVPANTPVDRVVFVPGVQPANFSREVRVRVAAVSPPTSDSVEEPQVVETAGSILRVHRVEDGHPINEEQLSVDAQAGLRNDATKWIVSIENGDDEPIALRLVRLEMVERDLCFDATPASGYELYYGDSALTAPRYDYASLFSRQPDAAVAKVGPEMANPAYRPRPDTRPFTERHPVLLWTALAAVIALLGIVALRSARQPAGAAR